MEGLLHAYKLRDFKDMNKQDVYYSGLITFCFFTNLFIPIVMFTLMKFCNGELDFVQSFIWTILFTGSIISALIFFYMEKTKKFLFIIYLYYKIRGKRFYFKSTI